MKYAFIIILQLLGLFAVPWINPGHAEVSSAASNKTTSFHDRKNWYESEEYTVIFEDPLWACDNICPPFLIVEVNDKSAMPMVGETTRVFLNGKDLYYRDVKKLGLTFSCTGKFKNTQQMYDLIAKRFAHENIQSKKNQW